MATKKLNTDKRRLTQTMIYTLNLKETESIGTKQLESFCKKKNTAF